MEDRKHRRYDMFIEKQLLKWQELRQERNVEIKRRKSIFICHPYRVLIFSESRFYKHDTPPGFVKC
jgi:hypothetical protein